jgi:hypothetical protein
MIILPRRMFLAFHLSPENTSGGTNMTINCSRVWFVSMACAILIALSGCVESERPLSDAKKAKVDNRLCGVWTKSDGSKTLVLVCGRSEIKGHPAGMMRLESIEMDNVNQTFLSLPLYFFISDVGEQSFFNLLSISGRMKPSIGEERPIDFGIEGDYQAFVGGPGEKYSFLRYQISRDRENKQDTLTLWEPDDDLAKKAVRRGAIKGTVGTKITEGDATFTDSSENLAAFFKSDLGKEMFSSGRRHVLTRIK